MNIAVFSGSFDPFTLGHMDILARAGKLFDAVYVGVLNNSGKRHAFSPEERKSLIEMAIEDCGLANVYIEAFDGLLVDFARKKNANCIVRGLRGCRDFEYEMPMERANRYLAGGTGIETVYLLAKPEYAFISSNLVREAGRLGGDISGLVPDKICKIIAERLVGDEQ